MLFINSTHPFLKIFNPATRGYAEFQGGRLELEEDDVNYGVVMAEAVRNPYIAIIVNATTCPDCGVVFTSASDLEAHRKDIHFDSWVAGQRLSDEAVIEKEIKARAGYACDVCAPVQTFGTADDLAAHVARVHASAPRLDDEGNDVGGGGAAATVSTEIPAATPSDS